ncbi:hypothetical protein KJ786_02415, partial [Patescibacteria group bacterium]|nr:hypothetical protein [Patescibacteria group bacterium]
MQKILNSSTLSLSLSLNKALRGKVFLVSLTAILIMSGFFVVAGAALADSNDATLKIFTIGDQDVRDLTGINDLAGATLLISADKILTGIVATAND